MRAQLRRSPSDTIFAGKPYLHTLPYTTWQETYFLAVLASFIEHAHRADCKPLRRGARSFVAVLGFVTLAFPAIIYYSYAVYARTCGEHERACAAYSPPVPFYLTMLIDYGWFVCLFLTPLYLPPNPVPVAKIMLLHSAPLHAQGPNGDTQA